MADPPDWTQDGGADGTYTSASPGALDPDDPVATKARQQDDAARLKEAAAALPATRDPA